jgi:hypothetical protein
MRRELKIRMAVLFSLCAGGMDASTGLLLMTVPAWTLGLMRVALPEPEALVYIRFIGSFVFGVGSLYLFALCPYVRRGRTETLNLVFGVTAWLRGVVFVFTSCAIVSGALSTSWLSVPLADGCFALFQFWIVVNRWLVCDD